MSSVLGFMVSQNELRVDDITSTKRLTVQLLFGKRTSSFTQ